VGHMMYGESLAKAEDDHRDVDWPFRTKKGKKKTSRNNWFDPIEEDRPIGDDEFGLLRSG